MSKEVTKVTLGQWKKNCQLKQSTFAFQLADRIWDEFKLPEAKDDLWLKVAFAVAGPQTDTDIKKGYSKQAKELIDEITDKCIDYSKKKYSNVYVSFIFVCAWVSEHYYLSDTDERQEVVVPLIRVRTGDSTDVTSAYYIDHTGRVYNNWAGYLEGNTFIRSWICVPKNGKYTNSDADNCVFCDQTGRGSVLEVADTVSTVTSVTSGISSLVGLGMLAFPLTAPIGATVLTVSAIAGAPGAVYGTGRSIGALIDRGTHDKSINPFTSSEARGAWLTTAVSILSVGAMGAGKALSASAKAGNLVSAEIRALCTTLNITNLTVSGLGVLNGFYEVSKKGKDVTALDVIQLTTSIFFFSHSLVNFKTASGIIKDAQRSHLGEIREGLAPRDQKKFDAMLQGQRDVIEPGKVREMHGNAKFIKTMNRVENKAQFFSDFKLIGGQKLLIHNEIVIHPRAFMQMNEKYRNDLVRLSKDLRNNKIDLLEFQRKFAPIQREFRLHTERQIGEVQTRISSFADRQINQRKIFKNLSRNEQIRLDQVCREAGDNYDSDRIDLGMRLAEKQGTANVTEFTAVMEYANRVMADEVKQLRQQNPNPPGRPPGESARQFYQRQVLEKYRNPGELEKLNDKFIELRARCDVQNNADWPQFGNSMAAANHFDKHKHFPRIDPNNHLTPERYFQIAREMAGEIGMIKWTQDGISLCAEITHEIYGAKLIRYDNLANGTTVIATLMHWDGDRAVPVAQRVIER